MGEKNRIEGLIYEIKDKIISNNSLSTNYFVKFKYIYMLGCVWDVCGCVWMCVDVCGCGWMCVGVCLWVCVCVCV